MTAERIPPPAAGGRTVPLPTRLGTFLAAFVAALAGVVPVFTLGLVAPTALVYPLALMVGAFFAALAAGWTATLRSPDGRRTRLLPVVALTAATALVVVVLLLAYLLLAGSLLPLVLDVRPIVLAVACVLALAAGATVGAWRYRTAEPYRGGDVPLTLALLAVAVASVPLALFVASLIGLTGA
jgi:hypothetical protein